MTRLSGNLSDIYGRMPDSIYQAYRQMYNALWTDGLLEPGLREMIRIRSAQLAGCRH